MENRLNETIIEMAHRLGDTIKEDERFLRYDAAQKAFSKESKLSRLITEYNAQQTALQSVYAKPDIEKELITAIEGRINTLYMEITEDETYKEFSEAKLAFDALMQNVNDEIYFALTGEAPHSSGCSGNCSGCAGCASAESAE